MCVHYQQSLEKDMPDVLLPPPFKRSAEGVVNLDLICWCYPHFGGGTLVTGGKKIRCFIRSKEEI